MRENGYDNCFESTIYFRQCMGAEDILNLRIRELVFQAVGPLSLDTRIKESGFVQLDIERAHFFDGETKERIGNTDIPDLTEYS